MPRRRRRVQPVVADRPPARELPRLRGRAVAPGRPPRNLVVFGPDAERICRAITEASEGRAALVTEEEAAAWDGRRHGAGKVPDAHLLPRPLETPEDIQELVDRRVVTAQSGAIVQLRARDGEGLPPRLTEIDRRIHLHDVPYYVIPIDDPYDAAVMLAMRAGLRC